MKYLVIAALLFTGCTGLEYDDSVDSSNNENNVNNANNDDDMSADMPDGPTITIVSPQNGAMVTNDPVDGVCFVAEATNAEGGIGWQSDKDGIVGSGENPCKILTADIHVITAAASDSQGVSASDTVTITVTDQL